MNILAILKNNGYTIGSVILLVYFLFIIWFEPSVEKIPLKGKNVPDFKFKNVVISQIDNGMLIWELAANEAEINKDDNVIDLYKAEGVFFEKETEYMAFYSEKGIYHINDDHLKLISASATVYLEKNNVDMNGKELIWNPQLREIIGKKVFLKQGDQLSVVGDDLYFNLNSMKISLKGNTSTVFNTQL